MRDIPSFCSMLPMLLWVLIEGEKKKKKKKEKIATRLRQLGRKGVFDSLLREVRNLEWRTSLERFRKLPGSFELYMMVAVFYEDRKPKTFLVIRRIHTFFSPFSIVEIFAQSSEGLILFGKACCCSMLRLIKSDTRAWGLLFLCLWRVIRYQNCTYLSRTGQSTNDESIQRSAAQ